MEWNGRSPYFSGPVRRYRGVTFLPCGSPLWRPGTASTLVSSSWLFSRSTPQKFEGMLATLLGHFSWKNFLLTNFEACSFYHHRFPQPRSRPWGFFSPLCSTPNAEEDTLTERPPGPSRTVVISQTGTLLRGQTKARYRTCLVVLTISY